MFQQEVDLTLACSFFNTRDIPDKQLRKYDDVEKEPNTFKAKKDEKYGDRDGFVKYLEGEVENSMKDVKIKD